jgi:sugar lactone lactonase YvrE
MEPKDLGAPLCALAAACSAVAFPAYVMADDALPFGGAASFTTLAVTPYAIEGLTGDAAGNLYTTGRAPAPEPCPVWRFDENGVRTQIGSIPNAPGACNPSGIAFDALDNLYVADANMGGVVWKLARNGDESFASPTTPFVTGAPGTNGLAFDRDGYLWTGDGTTGQGRVWRVAPSGGACEPAFSGCEEAFRIQPMANDKAVGRQAVTLPAGTAQPLVANGLAFTEDGDLYVADTARGAIWKVTLGRRGEVQGRTGCDTTFTANTLCMENILVAHPLLEGADGIVLDRAGNIWAAANERNAIVVAAKNGRVVEVFRNPVNAAGLRNSADSAAGNAHILETPTSPFFSGKRLCTANSDGNRRDNSPNSAGEVNSGGPVGNRGKISCMDQALLVPGLPLPVR